MQTTYTLSFKPLEKFLRYYLSSEKPSFNDVGTAACQVPQKICGHLQLQNLWSMVCITDIFIVKAENSCR